MDHPQETLCISFNSTIKATLLLQMEIRRRETTNEDGRHRLSLQQHILSPLLPSKEDPLGLPPKTAVGG